MQRVGRAPAQGGQAPGGGRGRHRGRTQVQLAAQRHRVQTNLHGAVLVDEGDAAVQVADFLTTRGFL